LSTLIKKLSTEAQGEQRAELFANALRVALVLLCMIRVSGARAEGSPACLASMRKCFAGLRNYYAPWTTFVTLNPSELQSQVVDDSVGACTSGVGSGVACVAYITWHCLAVTR